MTKHLKEERPPVQTDINDKHYEYLNSRLSKGRALLKKISTLGVSKNKRIDKNQEDSIRLRGENNANRQKFMELAARHKELSASPHYADQIEAGIIKNQLHDLKGHVTRDDARQAGVDLPRIAYSKKRNANISRTTKNEIDSIKAGNELNKVKARHGRVLSILGDLKRKKDKFIRDISKDKKPLSNPDLGDAITIARNKLKEETISERANPHKILKDYEEFLHKKLKGIKNDPEYKELKRKETDAELRATTATVRGAKSDSKSVTNITKFKTLVGRVNPDADDHDKLKSKIDRMAGKIPVTLAKEIGYDFPPLISRAGKTKVPGGGERTAKGNRTRLEKEYKNQKSVASDSSKKASDIIKSHIDKLTAVKKAQQTGDIPLDVAIDAVRFSNKQNPPPPIKPKPSAILQLGKLRPTKNDRF